MSNTDAIDRSTVTVSREYIAVDGDWQPSQTLVYRIESPPSTDT